MPESVPTIISTFQVRFDKIADLVFALVNSNHSEFMPSTIPIVYTFMKYFHAKATWCMLLFIFDQMNFG